MAILEDICFHHDIFPDYALDRITAALDQGLEVLDDSGRKLSRHLLTKRNSPGAKGENPPSLLIG
jgi:hypothetical protein